MPLGGVVICLRKMASLKYEEWLCTGIIAAICSDLFPEPQGPRVSSSISRLLSPPSARAHGKWMQMKFCALALCISSHLSLVTETFTAFYSWVLSGFLSQLWFSRLGSPAWGLDPTLLRGRPLSCSPPLEFQLPSMGAPPALLHPSTSHQSYFGEVVSFVHDYKASLQCSVGYSGWFLYNLVVIPDWSWEEVSK